MIFLRDPAERLPETDASRGVVRQLVDEYAARMGMHDWHCLLEVYWRPEDENDVASCYAEPESRIVNLTFNMAHIPTERLEWTVRHELLHALVWPLSHAADQYIASDQEMEWLRVETERVVDTLALMPVWT